MWREFVKMIVLASLVLPVVCLADVDSLPQAVANAQRLMSVKPLEKTVASAATEDLLRLSARYSDSPLVPEALLAAAQIDRILEHDDAALALARRVVIEFPTSTSAPAAFDLAWDCLTGGGKNALAGTELATYFASALGTAPTASHYYAVAFEAYRAAQQWQNALKVGAQFAAQCTAGPADAPLLLSLSEVALAANDTPLAQKLLENFLSRFDNLPQAIPARVQLANVYATINNKAAARENYSLAWTAFQKHRRNSGYAQSEVVRSAARALWELQAAPKRELERLAATGEPANESLIRTQADELLSAYQEVMRTDPALAPQALQASGDVRASVADAALATGFRRALGDVAATRLTPYRSALTEYGSAIALYKQAYSRANLDPESAEAKQVATRASVRAFDVTAGEGDAVCAWALELSRQAPPIAPGTAGKDARIAYLTTSVAPLLEEGLTYKTQALALSSTMPLAQNAEVLRRSLDVPLRPVVGELYALCHERLNTATASATQLAKTFSFGFQGSSTTPLIEAAEQDFAQASEIAAALQSALLRLYEPLKQSYLPPAELSFWDSLTVNSYHDYAALCHDFQDNLAVCLARLNKPTDDAEAAMHKRLARLQERGASAEFTGLVRWHEFAAGNEVDHPLNAQLAARLAKLDPKSYGDPDELPSASRRKP